jgi:hypothetical protein
MGAVQFASARALIRRAFKAAESPISTTSAPEFFAFWMSAVTSLWFASMSAL